jgi:hypothetical protein
MESLVDISNRLNKATGNEFAAYLLPFVIYAQSTLHEDATTNSTKKSRGEYVKKFFLDWI